MRKFFFIAFSAIVFVSCSSNQTKTEQPKDTTTQIQTVPEKQPKTSVEKTTVATQYFMVLKDSAKNVAEVGSKLAKMYGVIGNCAKECKMEMIGAPVAWYNNDKAPWIIEAGAPFKTTCKSPKNGIYNKEIKAGNAVVCHFFGPYEKLMAGYDAAKSYIQKNNLVIDGKPWEVYVSDPMTVKDPYLVQTDIYFPIK